MESWWLWPFPTRDLDYTEQGSVSPLDAASLPGSLTSALRLTPFLGGIALHRSGTCPLDFQPARSAGIIQVCTWMWYLHASPQHILNPSPRGAASSSGSLPTLADGPDLRVYVISVWWQWLQETLASHLNNLTIRKHAALVPKLAERAGWRCLCFPQCGNRRLYPRPSSDV